MSGSIRISGKHGVGLALISLAFAMSTTASATDLYSGGNWPALTSDRAAQNVGDSLTVLIQEASQATDSTQNVAKGGAGVAGQGSAGSYKNNGQINLSGNYNYSVSGQNGHSGQLVAQISVVVDSVLSNGDLHVAGDQLININGKKTQIHLTGRVRPADIGRANTVLSSYLADAEIVYGGPGLSRSDRKPGLFGRMFSWFRQ